MPRRPAHDFPFVALDGRVGLVRVAKPSDAKQSLAITLAIAQERPRTLAVTEGEIWNAKAWRDHRLPWCPDGVTLSADLDGKFVGALNIMRGGRKATRHSAEFGIYVAANARGVGVGTALIAASEAWAREHGVARIHLEVFATNPRAKALYAACGFEVEGIARGGMTLPEGRVDVIMMAKEL